MSRRMPRGKQQASFLVRFWWETREAPDQEPVLRCYVRSLNTHEEHYVGDPGAVGERIKALALEEIGSHQADIPNLGRGRETGS